MEGWTDVLYDVSLRADQNIFMVFESSVLHIMMISAVELDLIKKLGLAINAYEPQYEKTCLCHMWTTKAQISPRICAVWSGPLLFPA